MRDSFVFYSSFLDTIERAPEQVRLSLFTELCNCGLERKKLSEVEYPVCLFVTQAMANVERSNKRYEQAVENGKQGGRPKKWIDQTEAEKLFSELGSWNAVAEKLDVSPNTLYKARSIWEKSKCAKTSKTQKPQEFQKTQEIQGLQVRKNLKNLKNLNVNYNVNDNEKIYKDFSQLSLSKNLIENNPSDETDGTLLEAVPPPPGWEWRGGVLEDDGHHFRLAINKTTREGRGIQLD